MRFAALPATQAPPIDLADVAFVSSSEGYGVTGHGGIYRSDDAGRTWQRIYEIHSARFLQITMLGRSTGFVQGLLGCEVNCFGPAVLLVTSDAGKTWRQIRPKTVPSSAQQYFLSWRLLPISARVLYAAGDPDAFGAGIGFDEHVYKSTDGGGHWEALPLPHGFISLGGMSFLSTSRGYVSGEICEPPTCQRPRPEVLATADGGRHWRVVYPSPSHPSFPAGSSDATLPLFAVQFLTPSLGFTAGGINVIDGPPATESIILVTRDGGVSWRVLDRVKGQGSFGPITGLDFSSATRGWIAHGTCPKMGGPPRCTGVVSYTDDGGRTWTSPVGADYYSLHGASAWIVGMPCCGPPISGGDFASRPGLWGSALERSTDYGRTWQTLWNPAQIVVNTVQLHSPDAGWISTNTGIFMTRNGGASWIPANFGPPMVAGDNPTLLSARVALALHGTGPTRELLRSGDGGRTWQSVTLGLPAAASMARASLSTQGPDHAWLAVPIQCEARSSCPVLVLASGDGGRTWRRTATDLRGLALPPVLAFGDSRHGAALGADNRSLYVTDDGGLTWHDQPLPFTVSPHA
jgi:photosystem II stability/assembly factor-like uncharacterized protein